MVDSREHWREIDPGERALLMHLLRDDFQGRAEILEQMNSVEVMRVSPEGSLKLRTSGPVAEVKDSDAPSPRENDKIPVEGFYDDKTDSKNSFLSVAKIVRLALHVTDGRLSELEIYKEDGSTIVTDPYEIDLSRVHFY
ncbi:hypothetical protein GR247_38795 [Rhizobium leguminosarum]|jgi:hypothetical protein|uniref:DUF6984 domain-containing protein n=1 Tax=Rhizobium leguminosarum TaxID=384 RepID=A0A6P0DNV1_RHILE|nr:MULTISPECIES: hypothetical protein [Rhizobium]MBY3273662.1 hypothetical protein [Rhizobium laguerreae]MBY3326051.1 hypothetical protein [Rhizobium laguerreae]NEJ25962.1 hypothetical protein [Rhizobium leguminosarum]NEK54869.1 hypothetical protein [Rhizobium leguminosarum]NKM88105.1 hypothetical protein [Rhizobium laguerreae]